MRQGILELLRGAGDRYLSGEDIAEKLGVSRTAVWKHINELKSAGYNIESQARNGYRLVGAPDRLLPEVISHGRGTKLLPQILWPLRKFPPPIQRPNAWRPKVLLMAP